MIRYLLIALFFFSACGGEKIQEKKSPKHVTNKFNKNDPGWVLTAARNWMNGNTRYEQYVLDTLFESFAERYKELSVHFVKLNKVEEGYVTDAVYLLFCSDSIESTYSERPVHLSNEIVESVDSNYTIPLFPGRKFSLYYYMDRSIFSIYHRINNGTVYHAAIDYFYDIDPETLNLTYTDALESNAFLPLGGKNGLYMLRMSGDDGVDVYTYEPTEETKKNRGGMDMTLVGTYILKPGRAPMMNVIDTAFAEILITCSPNGALVVPDTAL